MNYKRNSLKLWSILMLVGILLGVIAPERMQAQASDGTTIKSTRLSDPVEVEKFWDRFFAREMKAFGVYGAVMVMVDEDQVLFAKGYGYADAAQGVRIDPQKTILRAGSIAKSLTATAVMQLAEQGRLDLDADVNNYLTRFKVAGTFPEAVTTRQLINMTGGFDTRFVGIRAASLDEVIPLGEYLAERMPPRVLPPGRYRRYNDHELALAGYLVEVTSGVPYEEYVQQHIFEPLEMYDSSVLLPDEELERAARGYPVGASPDQAYPLNYYYLNIAPGAGFNTTALDIANFMMAHLGDGQYTRGDGDVARILEADTAREMHQTSFTYHPRLAGQANTFDEQFFNGRRYLRKLGGAPGMQNNMLLLTDQKLGFYLFVNSDGTGLRNDWEREVAKMYLSGPTSTTMMASTASKVSVDTNAYAGYYRQISDQTSETTIVNVQALFDPDSWLEVTAQGEAELSIGGQVYLAESPVLFENGNSGRYTAFELDPDGKAAYLFQARTPYERVSWIETPEAQLYILGFALLVFLTGIIAGAVGLIRRKRDGRPLIGLISLLNMLFLVGLALLLLPVASGGDKWQFTLEPSIMLHAVLAIPLVTILLTISLLVKTISAWREGRSSLLVRLHSISIMLAMAGFVYFLNTWNLLGWRF